MTQTERRSTLVAPSAGSERLPCRVGAWELLGVAAEGSLTRVFRARPRGVTPDGPARYALKMLRPPWCDDARAVALMRREALVGRRLSHPHLISILQASLARPPQYVVMPWLEGATLRTWLDTGRRLDLPVALWIVRQVAEALEALHAAGWMHGDIKPANIFVAAEGHATLLDLGFARRSDETGSAADRWVAGTFHYIAPEWITSSFAADGRSDFYSLGVVLFEILAGRLPFLAESLADLAGQHRRLRPPDLRRLARHLPDAVVALVNAMLAKDPLRRPQTARELVDRLVGLEIATFSERGDG